MLHLFQRQEKNESSWELVFLLVRLAAGVEEVVRAQGDTEAHALHDWLEVRVWERTFVNEDVPAVSIGGTENLQADKK